MEHRHVKNISALIHFMNDLHTERFDMRAYVHSCGSPSCALGWACTVPELKAEGLNIEHLKNHALGSPSMMATAVFGEYLDLFRSRYFETVKTPQDWATHARSFLKSRGHDVLPKTERQRSDFMRFMEIALKPLEPEMLASSN